MYAENTVPLLGGAAASGRSKGECGNIATIGGCEEYVGAPMFAAAAALSCGADLSHIYCSSAASSPIKSQVHALCPPFKSLKNCNISHASPRNRLDVTLYQAPNLIVHPSWAESSGTAESPIISKWLPRHTALVVGSGLGRDVSSLAVASHALEAGQAFVCLDTFFVEGVIGLQLFAWVFQLSLMQTRFLSSATRRQSSGKICNIIYVCAAVHDEDTHTRVCTISLAAYIFARAFKTYIYIHL